ncbi:MAG TPA: PHP domain-containing protein, partial [Gemmatimonadales bacterium]|nr:PHP domain-containing protein [Gemmatimonadales bacterium]
MFVHLHCHSHFSFGQGASHPESLVAAAVARGYTALACTDTNGVYGAVEFQKAAEAAGIRPILGAHLVYGGEECVVLAEDERGWATICRMISAIHWASPSPSRERGSGGEVIPGGSVLSQHLHDRTGLCVLSNDVPLLERLAVTSGTSGLYAELRPGKERHAVLAAATRLGIPPVVTGAVMFAHPEEWAKHRLLAAIAGNVALSAVESLAASPPRRL